MTVFNTNKMFVPKYKAKDCQYIQTKSYTYVKLYEIEKT